MVDRNIFKKENTDMPGTDKTSTFFVKIDIRIKELGTCSSVNKMLK